MANTPSPNDLTRQQLDELDALLQRMLALPPSKPVNPPTPVPAVANPAPGVDEHHPSRTEWRTDRPASASPTPHLLTTTTPQTESGEMVEAIAASPPTNVLTVSPTPAEPVMLAPAGPISAPESPSGPAVAFAPASPPLPPTPALPFEPRDTAVMDRTFRSPLPELDPPAPSANLPTPTDPTPLVQTTKTASVPNIPEFGPLQLNDIKPVSLENPPQIHPAAAAQTVPVARPGVPVLLWPLFAMNWILEKLLAVFGPPGQALTTPLMKHCLGWVGIILLIASAVWTARGLGWIQFPLHLP